MTSDITPPVLKLWCCVWFRQQRLSTSICCLSFFLLDSTIPQTSYLSALLCSHHPKSCPPSSLRLSTSLSTHTINAHTHTHTHTNSSPTYFTAGASAWSHRPVLYTDNFTVKPVVLGLCVSVKANKQTLSSKPLCCCVFITLLSTTRLIYFYCLSF